MSIKREFKSVLLAAIAVCLLAGEHAFAGEVKFVHFTDVHITDRSKNRGRRMLEQSGELLKNAVRRVNAVEDLDFVIFTGDMIDIPDKNLLKKFTTAANELNAPWYWTTGNHDVGPGLNKRDFVAEMNRFNGSSRTKPYYSFIIDDFIFICMDGTIDNIPTAHARFSPKELEWLDGQLEKNSDKYALIFQHFPVVEPFKSNDHYILNAKEYLEVLDGHNNVIAVLSGHYHIAEINRRNGVMHVSSPALVQRPNAVRLITVSTRDGGASFDSEFIITGSQPAQIRRSCHTP